VMHPYRFGPRTQATTRGMIDFVNPTNTAWMAQVANDGFSYWKFTADRAQANLIFTNNILRISDFDADFYGGKLRGQAVFALTNSVDYRFDFNAERCDVQAMLTAVHPEKKSRVTGTLSGRMNLSGQGSDLGTLRGNGNLEITDGVLWEAPLFGIFSQILGNTKATNAKATFTIADQAVVTDDLEIKDLNSKTKRFNLDAKVTEKSSLRTILSRWGEALLLSTATIMDRSGTITLPLWKEQTSMISVGDLIHIENARLKRFRGELQVRVDRLAKLRVVESPQN